MKKEAWISTEALVKVAAFIARLEARRVTFKLDQGKPSVRTYNDGVLYGMDICIGGLQGLVKELELK